MGLLRARVYWPGMHNEVKDYLGQCRQCTLNQAQSLPSHLLASRPLEILAVDFTKLEMASDGREDVLAINIGSGIWISPGCRGCTRQGEDSIHLSGCMSSIA
ncbi:hypothetical protein BaRGS_00019409 [Batillaria attramentaria]|uniref:Integrase zinc-binding domain-containing protein n=1 Tax=Batillaria attramentaria TaxID=370345 RepID=A0ABD0KQF0_9CAEN